MPIEASVSLRRGAMRRELRCTLGVRATPHDPDARAGLRSGLIALEAGPPGTAADDALTRVARGGPNTPNKRALALRAVPGRVRPRVGARIGGDTVVERSARIADALRELGLDAAAQSHADIATVLMSNPFAATIPYGLGLELTGDRIGGAKTYFRCEAPDVLLDHIHRPVAQALGLEGVTTPFDSLAALGGSSWRRTRWLLEASFELPADPVKGPRIKLYVPPGRLAASGIDARGALQHLAAELGLDSTPYLELVHALGEYADRSSLMMGVSVSGAGTSVEAYIWVAPKLRILA